MRTLIQLLLFPLSLFAQVDNLLIEIKTDNRPNETHWTIYDEDGRKLFGDDDQGFAIVLPNNLYAFNITISEGQCIRFEITDSGADGIGSDGFYKITRNNDLLILGGEFNSFAEHYSGCDLGSDCDNAIEIFSERISTDRLDNLWFSISPNETAFYGLNACANATDTGFINSRMWIYEGCPPTISDTPEGALAFNDELIFCEPSSGFAAIELVEGTQYFIRVNIQDPTYQQLFTLIFGKLENILGCTDPNACNYNPFANDEDGSCEFISCAPDLKVDQEALIKSIIVDKIEVADDCLIREGCVSGPGVRELIRFATKIDNIGTADYIIGNPEDNLEAFSSDNCHDHYHHLGYAEYLLFEGSGQPIPVGFKNGFCMSDLSCSGQAGKYNCNYMGVGAGCFDIYDNATECQWIDITDVADGDYNLVVRVNWNRLKDLRGFEELNYENNWAQACVNINRSMGLTVNVIDNCSSYTDCLGIDFGQAVKDCTGVCGGTAEYADLDQSGKLDMNDIEDYLLAIQEKNLSASDCFDLNDDQNISIYDVALAYKCIMTNEAEKDNPFHTHCVLPSGSTNEEDVFELTIDDFNPIDKFIDVSYQSPFADIAGYQFTIDGVMISQTEVLGGELILPFSNQDQVFGFGMGDVLARNNESSGFARIHYSMLTGDTICIVPSSIQFINSDYQLMVDQSLSTCLNITANENIEEDEIIVFPNPANSFISIQPNSNDIISYTLFDISGQQLIKSNRVKKKNEIDISDLNNGVYFIKLYRDEVLTVFKIIKQ